MIFSYNDMGSFRSLNSSLDKIVSVWSSCMGKRGLTSFLVNLFVSYWSAWNSRQR